MVVVFYVCLSVCLFEYLSEEYGDGEVSLAHTHHLMGSRKLAF